MDMRLNVCARRVMRRLDILEIKVKLGQVIEENPTITKTELIWVMINMVEEYGFKSVPISLLKYVMQCSLEVSVL